MTAERATVASNPYRVTPLRQAPAARVIVILLAVAAIAVNCHTVVTWHSSDSMCHVSTLLLCGVKPELHYADFPMTFATNP